MPTPVPPTPTPVPPPPLAARPQAASAQCEAPGPRGCDPEFVAAYQACLSHPERFNLAAWVAAYDWPYDEAMTVFGHESGGDLCAVNRSSGAICWVQQITGQAYFFDPYTCIAQGYAKWAPTRSFWQHWYQWWG